MVKGSWLAPRSLQCQLRACYMKCCCSQQVTHQRHLISQLWVSKRCAWLCAMVGHFIEARQCNLLLDGRAFWSNLQGQRIFPLLAYTVDTGLPHAIHSPRRVHVCCRSHEWSKTQRASPESPVSPDCRLGDGKQSQQVGTRQSRDKRSSVWKTTWQRRGRSKKMQLQSFKAKCTINSLIYYLWSIFNSEKHWKCSPVLGTKWCLLMVLQSTDMITCVSYLP